jgi:hypothetical protein
MMAHTCSILCCKMVTLSYDDVEFLTSKSCYLAQIMLAYRNSAFFTPKMRHLQTRHDGCNYASQYCHLVSMMIGFHDCTNLITKSYNHGNIA